MAVIVSTSKLGANDEYCFVSGGYVFFRMVRGRSRVQFMTATAPNDDSGHVPYPETEKLLAATCATFAQHNYVEKKDRKGRSYVEVYFLLKHFDENSLEHDVARILNGLGFFDVQVLALREAISIHSEFAHDDDQDAYLSDGVYITPDGRLVEY